MEKIIDQLPIGGESNDGFLVFHMNQDALNLREGVLIVSEVGQKVDNGVANFRVKRFAIPFAHDGARVVLLVSTQTKHEAKGENLTGELINATWTEMSR